MTDVRSRLASGAAWLGGARLATNVLAFATTLVLARILVPADFGLVALATTILAIVNAATDISLAAALVQHPAPERKHLDTAWTLNAGRAALVAAMFAGCAVPAAWLYDEPRLAPVMATLAASVLLSGLGNPRAVLMQRDLVFRQQFLMDVSQRLAAVVVSVSVALAFESYWALVFGTVAGQAAQLAVSYLVAPYRPRPALSAWRELMGFSIWLTLGQLVNTINWRFDHLLIGSFLGRSALGFYAVGDNLAAMPSREALAPLNGALFPAFSRLAGTPDRLRPAFQTAQAVVVTAALPVGVGVSLVAEPTVLLAMGDKWLPAVPVIQVLSAVFAAQALGTLAQPLAMAAGETKLLFRRDLQSFAVRVPLVVAGMVLGGLAGIVYARAVSGAIAIGLNLAVARHVTGLAIRTQLAASARPLAAAGIMAVAATAVSSAAEPSAGRLLALAATVATGGLVYPAALIALWMAAGRPAGAEREIARLLGRALRRISPASGG